mmetsp:Transcript_11387/g.16379  ORF Transcript_11387/g.16379 Transcript_11387/m.16379 type:complete len:97 (+) Transcript_11387:1338-1628(+)
MFLCRLLLKGCTIKGNLPKSIFGCIKCGKGFHVHCFTAFHFTGALQNPGLRNEVVHGITLSQETESCRDKVSECINDIQHLSLYCQDKMEEVDAEE